MRVFSAGLERRLTLRPGVELRPDADLTLAADGRCTTLRVPPPVRAQLLELADPDGLAAVTPHDGRGAGVDGVLARIGHLVQERWAVDGEVIMTRQATVRSAAYTVTTLDPSRLVRLDRFALLRSRGDDLVLESPRARHRFVLAGGAARVLAAELGRPTKVADLDQCVDDGLAQELVSHWVAAGVAEQSDPDGSFASDTDPVLRQWDFHDLVMHSRTRSGRFDEPLGALSPYRGAIDPLPAVVPERPDALLRTPLPRPATPSASRLALGEALETRRSIRDYDDRPVTADELGEFLYRVFRDRARFDPPDSDTESKVSRPYPSGGGLYEHELYVSVVRCEGVRPGIHRYDPARHCLELINDDERDVERMLAVAAAATGHPARPDLLLTITARFQRMAWRYRSIAYANVLRTTGAIYQTMYLVATDLGLAPCALGNGDADLSASVLGLDYLQESSVGDFLLGRRRADDSVEGAPLAGWTILDDH